MLRLTLMERGDSWWLLWIPVALAAACGSATNLGEQPSWRSGTLPGDDRVYPRDILFAPDHPGVNHYNGDAPALLDSDLVHHVVEEATSVAVEQGRPKPVLDARLSAAARSLAQVSGRAPSLPNSFIDFSLHHFGIVEPSPHLILFEGDARNVDELQRQLRAEFVEVFASDRFNRIGVGAFHEDNGSSRVIVAMQDSEIYTRPFPRELTSRKPALIEGTIATGFTNAQLFVTQSDGSVTQSSIDTLEQGRFSTKVVCRSGSEKIKVEITAADGRGSRVLANFPLWCNSPAQTAIQYHFEAGENAEVSDRSEAEALMAKLVNDARRSHGLAPLSVDDRLLAVARAHSDEMLATGIVAHVSSTTGSAADRVRKARIKTSLVLENIARAYGVREAQEGLMNSPGHRGNLLSRDATHMGIGVAWKDDGAGRRELVVTQVFTRVPAPIDATLAREKVKEAILAVRDLREDGVLGVVAQQVVAELVNGASTQAASRRAASRLNKLPIGYAKVTTLATAVSNLTSFQPGGAISEPKIRAFGVGVAQGDHDVMGEDSIFIVILLGHQ